MQLLTTPPLPLSSPGTCVGVMLRWIYLCLTACSDRSIAEANRPNRRAVLDRERARAVAEKQAEALVAARASAEQKTEKKMQVKFRPHAADIAAGAGLVLRVCCNPYPGNTASTAAVSP